MTKKYKINQSLSCNNGDHHAICFKTSFAALTSAAFYLRGAIASNFISWSRFSFRNLHMHFSTITDFPEQDEQPILGF